VRIYLWQTERSSTRTRCFIGIAIIYLKPCDKHPAKEFAVLVKTGISPVLTGVFFDKIAIKSIIIEMKMTFFFYFDKSHSTTFR
jgi:hypothetical protein